MRQQTIVFSRMASTGWLQYDQYWQIPFADLAQIWYKCSPKCLYTLHSSRFMLVEFRIRGEDKLIWRDMFGVLENAWNREQKQFAHIVVEGHPCCACLGLHWRPSATVYKLYSSRHQGSQEISFWCLLLTPLSTHICHNTIRVSRMDLSGIKLAVG